MTMREFDGKNGALRRVSALRQRPISTIGIAGAAILAGFVVADGIRNRAPDDAPAIRPAPTIDEADEVSASFPHAAARTDSSEKADECDGQATGPAVTKTRPIGDQGRWLASMDYPLASLEAGHEGVSSVVLAIDRRGMVANCTVAQSSGDSLLDAAACSTLKARARYEAARDAMGCPVPTSVRQRVRWQIPTE